MKNKKIATRMALAIAATLSASVPANATIYNATYSGTIGGYYPQDVTGIFGPPTTSLYGVPYTVVYRIDDGLAGAEPYIGALGPLYGSYVRGGANYSTTVIPVSAVLTINGHSETITASAQGVSQVIRYSNGDSRLDYVDGDSGYINMVLNTYPDRVIATADFRELLEYDVPSYLTATGGGFAIYQNDAQTYRYAFGGLNIAHISVQLAPIDLPEPATGLIILAAGILAAATRRRSLT